jgi:hypothetical protein
MRPIGRPGHRGYHPHVQEAELASAAAELYALSPGDFTAARDERVAQARASGDRDLARAIGALRRPVVSAWLVNQLVRAAGDQVGELLALGESLRQAHQDLAGEQVRDLSVRRRQLVAALLAEAKRIAERDGRPAGLQVEREVEATLQAALADPGAAEAVRAGCLSSPLSYAGLGAGDEAGAVSWQRAPARERAPEQAPAGERPPAREKAPARERGRRAAETAAEREARLAAAEAERQARQATAEAERRAAAERAVRTAADAAAAAAADLAGAEARAASARTAQESARRLVERLDKELSHAIAAESEANRAVRDAQRAKEAAARAADAAQRRLARAQTAADRLG